MRVQRTRSPVGSMWRLSLGVSALVSLMGFSHVILAVEADEASDAARIFTLILDERLKSTSEGIGGDYLVVENETLMFCSEAQRKAGVRGCDWHDAEGIRRGGEGAAVPESLLAALLADSEQPVAVPELKNAKMVSPSVIRRIFASKGWWDEFYRIYPGSRGVLRFSQPAFSQNRAQALVYVSHSCGGLCGTGWLVLLVKNRKAWQIESQSMLWIS